MSNEKLANAMRKFDVTIDATFVPWSQSRSAKKDPKFADYNLNWRVTLKVKGRAVLTTDYSAGLSYCPSYKQGERLTIDYVERIKNECETGKRWRSTLFPDHKSSILLDATDVVYSLLLDSDAIYDNFEDWANSFGYDEDSRSAELIYRECLEIAFTLRNSLSAAAFKELQEAAQDY